MNISQRELARRVGVTQSHIWKWENGEVLPSAQSMGRLMAHCNVEFQVMFEEMVQIYTRDLYDQVRAAYDEEKASAARPSN